MADHNDSSLVVVERLSDHREMTEVDMIRRFVEDEEIGSLDDKTGITEESLLSFGHTVDRIFQDIAREEKCGSDLVDFLIGDLIGHLMECISDDHIHIECIEVLAIVSYFHIFVDHGFVIMSVDELLE
ncbi:hypothetical protein KAZ93_03345 [Patescibacteria group bacterium]|nr:hypothetical protein [Patescibacteria group bacterium]